MAYQHVRGQYALHYEFQDKDTLRASQSTGLRRGFSSSNECFLYIKSLTNTMQQQGYWAFSVDSIRYDSLFAEAWIYVGEKYRWRQIVVKKEDETLFQNVGWSNSSLKSRPDGLQSFQNRVLTYLENNGYPFASVKIDSITIDGNELQGIWKIEKGPRYKIDSITVQGNSKLSTFFLGQYLGIPSGSIYKKEKLESVSSRLRDLSFIKETAGWEMNMVGTGSVLNLHLDHVKSSQINGLIGFLPSNGQLKGKTLITGEFNLNLKNAFATGETIAMNWQQLQIRSPRLDIMYIQPYVFRSKFGLDFNFNLFKKDSSFVTINMRYGIAYAIDGKQSATVFYQLNKSNLLEIDTFRIKQNKSLPSFLDVSSDYLGVDYQLNTTDYRRNPRKGTELYFAGSGGVRKVRKNLTISSLKTDESGNDFDFNTLYDTIALRTYIFRPRLDLAHYFRLGKQTTLKLGMRSGWVVTDQPFKNEVFQIGGYKLLRGFDEESIYAGKFGVLTTEFRYLIGMNAFLFGFVDAAWTQNRIFSDQSNHSFWGSGFGVSLETKVGMLNLSYAVGKRDADPFDFKMSKIHFGFVSLF
ncbi:MAG: hypothetical protein ACO29O_07285 [Chitinophagaceae bacterium]